MKRLLCVYWLACALGLHCVVASTSAEQAGRALARPLDVIYIPTPREVVTAMLQMAHVGGADVVYDLGSGDGRIVIAPVKEFGASRAVGIDIDESRIQEANENARQAGVKSRVEFRKQNLFDTSLSEATVVALYLSPTVNLQLHQKFLAELKPGTRIVSHAFDMGDWMPLETRTVSGRMVYLWTIPMRP
jgi:precorrin-6B methylase 2